MATGAVETQRWARADHHRKAAQGILALDVRTEVLAGTVCLLSPQTSWNAATIHLVGGPLAEL